jgi:hypothetical protein
MKFTVEISKTGVATVSEITYQVSISKVSTDSVILVQTSGGIGLCCYSDWAIEREIASHIEDRRLANQTLQMARMALAALEVRNYQEPAETPETGSELPTGLQIEEE